MKLFWQNYYIALFILMKHGLNYMYNFIFTTYAIIHTCITRIIMMSDLHISRNISRFSSVVLNLKLICIYLSTMKFGTTTTAQISDFLKPDLPNAVTRNVSKMCFGEPLILAPFVLPIV